MSTPIFDSQQLKKWFLQAKRSFPWRENPTPYAVWVSEIMLQQTQAAVVVPYFKRWMNRFPTIKSLSEASLDEILKLWEGLGYYSRARNLHAGAKYLMQQHQGEFPQLAEEIRKIKGIGEYTVGAICSFAFHQRKPAVDGNVMRVLSRYFCYEEDLSQNKNQIYLRKVAETILPENESWIISEALIELGALVCKKKPNCPSCPLKHSCKGFLLGKAEELPFKSRKTKIEQLFRAVAIVQYKDKLLLRRGQEGEIMSDLYEFPYHELSEEGISIEQMEKQTSQKFGKVAFRAILEKETHSFTRYRVKLLPFHFVANMRKEFDPPYYWISIAEIEKLPFSSGHKRVLSQFYKSSLGGKN